MATASSSVSADCPEHHHAPKQTTCPELALAPSGCLVTIPGGGSSVWVAQDSQEAKQALTAHRVASVASLVLTHRVLDK